MTQPVAISKGIILVLTIACIHACTTQQEKTGRLQEPSIHRMHTIVIQQMKFTPAALTVNEGDSVTWINNDIVAHNVTEETRRKWFSPSLPPGKSWSMAATKSATYLCTIHPVMKGTLNVSQ